MNERTFADCWAEAQFCYFKAEAAKGPASKHLWIQLAQDWIALGETLVPQSGEQDDYRGDEQSEQLEPFLVA